MEVEIGRLSLLAFFMRSLLTMKNVPIQDPRASGKI
jgi:hypothetical protein